MMTMDDDQSEAVDWGDGDDGPEETAESIAAGVEADAISLASDDEDDLEALKKYHHNTWDDGREPVASEQASQQDPPPTSAPTTGPVEQQQRDDKSTRDSVPTVHGLPPKPSTAVSYSKAPTSMPVSTSATAMAQHTSGPNGNHNGSETRKVLPPGWEVRNSTSQPSQVYYYHHEAGKTQWEFPTEALRPTRSASSRERGKRLDRPRRSRSREQRARRRSLSPPRGGNTYRPRSRSMERDIPHRSARHVSPKREPPPRVERERQAPKVRSRPSSRERRPSPKPLHRSRSPPPRVRESRDDPRQGGRQESSQQQHHSSSRHIHSQERDSYRPPQPPKPLMDIDRHEQGVHGTLRRRRSWGSPDASDIKRRRVAVSPPPPPRKVDRYVPDRSSRMDVDPPARRQETKRSTVPDVYERTSEMRQALPDPPPPPPSRDRRDDRPRAMSSSHPQLPVPPRDRREERPRENQQPQSLPQPPPRDRRDRPAGDREYHHSATGSQRTSPPQTLNATEQPAPVPRSRVPLPPQSEAMRLGGKRAPPPSSSSRYAPMDVDTNDTYRPPPSENSNARNVDRSRGRRSRSPPPPRSYDDGGSRPKGGPSGSYDMPPRTDRAMYRETGDSRNGAPSRPPLPPDPYRANQRERPSKPPGPISTSNNIPLSNPKEFGRPAVNQKNDEVASQLDSENARYPQGPPPEQASTTSSPGNETKLSGDSAPKRQRQSRFGPAKLEAKQDEIEAPKDNTAPEGQEEVPMVPAEEPQDPESIAFPVPSKPVALQRSRETKEEALRDLPPHMAAGVEQDVHRAPHARREDGLRINRNRTSISDPVEQSGEISGVAGKPPGPSVVEERRGSHEEAEPSSIRTAEQAPATSPPLEASKPMEIRQTTLLERISIPMEYDGDGPGVEVAEEGAAAGTDKRKTRGKRQTRAVRR